MKCGLRKTASHDKRASQNRLKTKTELDASFFIKSVILDEKDTPGLRCKKILGLYSHRNNGRMRKELEPHSENRFGAL